MVELNNLENIKKLENNLENNRRERVAVEAALFFMRFGEIKKFFKKIF